MSFVDVLGTEDPIRNIVDELDMEGDEEESNAGLDDSDFEGNAVCERISLLS